MTTWKITKLPSSFPSLWNSIIKEGIGVYIIGNFPEEGGESELRRLKMKWNYFTFSIRNNPSSEIGQAYQKKYVRIKTNIIIRNTHTWLEVTVEVSWKGDEHRALLSALAG